MRQIKSLLLFTSLCYATTAWAQSGSCGTALNWSITDHTMTITGEGDMSIGSTASYAIYKDDVKTIIMGEGITTIDNAAFKGFTSLSSVTFPSTLLDIKKESFSGCSSLQNINLPESLQKIGEKAFYNCDLHGLTVPRNVIEVGNSAFDYNEFLDVVIWNCNIPKETYIDAINYGSDKRSFFSNGYVRKVVFGPEVTEIPDQLFYGTSLNEIEIQGTISYVGANAFESTPWMQERATQPIYVGKCLYYWPLNYNSPTKIEVAESTLGITPRVFADHSYLVEVTLPASLEYMGGGVFANCSSLTHVNYNPTNLTAISNQYYKGNYHRILGPSLAGLTVGESVKSLPKRLCHEQVGLKEVILPNVEIIGKECFKDCKGLVSVQMEKVKYIDDSGFLGTGIKTLSLPNSLEYIGSSAFSNIPDQENIVFGPNLKSIGYSVFSSVGKIENLYLNSSLPDYNNDGHMATQVNNLYIGDEVTVMPPCILFDSTISGGNYVCKTMTVGRGIESKPKYSAAFKAETLYWNALNAKPNDSGSNNNYYVTNCTKVIVGSDVKSLPNQMISAYHLEEVSLPEGLEAIGNQVFYNAKIKSLTLPKSIKEIGKYAFRYCSDLESVIVGWEDPRHVSVTADAFSAKNTEAVLFVPKGTDKLYASLDPWKQFVNIANDPESWEKPQCAAPVITFEDGKLMFSSETDGTVYHYNIADSDIKSGDSSNGVIGLNATYEISAYCEASGYINSDITYTTLCFLSQGESAGIADINADCRGVAVCVTGQSIVVSGLEDNEEVSLYDTSGRLLATTKAIDGKAYFHDITSSNNIAIVKINNDSIKVAL
ncbi:MAG: leucine-rich repeat domain-containing protein [Pseudoflavonifractor sp.]|nr:leucine-rich repeat domain-containing protein [Pseudoflavonifractor sp.]